jgi:hypothetical protein
MLKIEMSLANSAFCDCNGTEIARILRGIADKCDGSHLDGVVFNLRDINGNKVGTLEIDEDFTDD